MALFYKREETEKEVVLCFKYIFLLYIVIFIGFVLSYFFSRISIVIWGFVWGFLAIYIIDVWKPRWEIKKVMKKGYVKFSGSKLSFSNPLRAVIDKQPNSSGSED